MRAKDIMATPVVTVHPEVSIKEAATLLLEHQISALPVIDEADELIGIVSEADLLPLETGPDPRSQILPILHRATPVPRTVREVMTRQVMTLPEDADASQAARLMLEEGVKRVPIVSGNRVVGILARRDLLRMLARTDAEIRAEVQELLDDEILMLGWFNVIVSDGVVTLTGSPRDRTSCRLAELLTRSVPGVLEVEFVEVSP